MTRQEKRIISLIKELINLKFDYDNLTEQAGLVVKEYKEKKVKPWWFAHLRSEYNKAYESKLREKVKAYRSK